MERLFAFVSCCVLVGACGGDDDSAGGDDEPVVEGADPSFGGDGMVTAGFPGGLSGLMRVARQADGKVVGVGGTQESLLVMRLGTDGALDTSFGNEGVVQLPWGSATNGITVGYGCVIQDDGKIVLAARVLGTYDGLMPAGVVVRLLSDGELDPDFAGVGYVVGPPGSGALSAALQADGKIVVGGYGRLERYLTDGTLDATFGTDGASTEAAGLQLLDLVVQPDGAIVSIGAGGIARFTPDGARDDSFGTAGVVTVGSSGSDALYGVALQGDGKIVVGGAITVPPSGTQGFWIGRYDTAGVPDPDFGSGGYVTGDPDTSGLAYGVGVDSSGRIVGTGYIMIGGNAGRSARFTPDGDPDPTFGGAGVGALFQKVLFSNPAIDPDGSITAAGAGFGTATTFAPVFTRTDTTGAGTVDVGLDVGGSFDRAHAIVVDGSGRVVIGGWANTGGGLGIARFAHDGTPDPTFGVDGKLVRSDHLTYVNALAVRGSRLLVGGLTSGSPSELVIEAYDDAGVLDPTFGEAGVAGGDVFAGYDAVSMTFAIGGDGAIFVVGQTSTEAGFREYAVVKLTEDGDRDDGYGTGGAAATAFGGSYAMATHAVVDDDGGLVLLGLAGNAPTLVRFDASGTLDDAFGTVVVSDVPSMLPFGLARQSDGKLVVVAGTTTGELVIARYGADGAPDPGFGTDGVVTRTFGGNDYYVLYAFTGLTVLPDDRIIVGLAGAADDGLTEAGILLRLDADGRADDTLAPDGVTRLEIGRGSTSIHALTVDASGQLLAAGRTWTETGSSEMMALRFLP